MAGRLEDEYWNASEAKAFNFEDDEVSVYCIVSVIISPN